LRRVLLVDDDDVIRQTFQLMLEFEGYEVVPAVHGAEALKILSSGANFGLILLDLMMPVMNGWQFLEKMRQSKEWLNIPVVVVTAFAAEAKKIAGASGILSKPVDVDTLLAEVRKQIKPPAAA
jgi:CheY-like chemotaxis protein